MATVAGAEATCAAPPDAGRGKGGLGRSPAPPGAGGEFRTPGALHVHHHLASPQGRCQKRTDLCPRRATGVRKATGTSEVPGNARGRVAPASNLAHTVLELSMWFTVLESSYLTERVWVG